MDHESDTSDASEPRGEAIEVPYQAASATIPRFVRRMEYLGGRARRSDLTSGVPAWLAPMTDALLQAMEKEGVVIFEESGRQGIYVLNQDSPHVRG